MSRSFCDAADISREIVSPTGVICNDRSTVASPEAGFQFKPKSFRYKRPARDPNPC